MAKYVYYNGRKHTVTSIKTIGDLNQYAMELGPVFSVAVEPTITTSKVPNVAPKPSTQLTVMYEGHRYYINRMWNELSDKPAWYHVSHELNFIGLCREVYNYAPDFGPYNVYHMALALGFTSYDASLFMEAFTAYKIFNTKHIIQKETDNDYFMGFPKSLISDYRDHVTKVLLSTQGLYRGSGRYPWVINKVIFNDPATIVLWKDGEKTVVKCGKGDKFDPEKGLVMAIAKKVYGNKGDYYDQIKKWLPKEETIKKEVRSEEEIQRDKSVTDILMKGIRKGEIDEFLRNSLKEFYTANQIDDVTEEHVEYTVDVIKDLIFDHFTVE